MSKRKKRSSAPNLPKSELDRARKEMGIEPPAPDEPDEQPVEVEDEFQLIPPPIVTAIPRPSSGSPRIRTTRRRSETARDRSGRTDQLDMDIIKDRLEHPTRIVTEAELRQEYGYVAQDLRSMGVLAAILIVIMISIFLIF